jgi:hypothetical protein
MKPGENCHERGAIMQRKEAERRGFCNDGLHNEYFSLQVELSALISSPLFLSNSSQSSAIPRLQNFSIGDLPEEIGQISSGVAELEQKMAKYRLIKPAVDGK